MFEELGAVILDADQAARRVVEPGSGCRQKLFDLLGPDFFDESGNLKRRVLRERIVEDEHLRTQINAILHPSIMADMESEWRKLLAETEHPRIAIFDIPLLFEGRLQDQFQRVILVYTPRHVQIERLMNRDGLSQAEAENTLSMQWPIEAKKALSQIVIDNGGDIEATRRQVKGIWEELVRSYLSDTR
jgi:dephospho-CoA kinase